MSFVHSPVQAELVNPTQRLGDNTYNTTFRPSWGFCSALGAFLSLPLHKDTSNHSAGTLHR